MPLLSFQFNIFCNADKSSSENIQLDLQLKSGEFKECLSE